METIEKKSETLPRNHRWREPPDESRLSDLLGYAYTPLEAIRGWLRWAHCDIAEKWTGGGATGWRLDVSRKGRRLFILHPEADDFRLSVVVGHRALALLKRGPFAARVESLMASARRSPEGVEFVFRADGCDPDLVIGILEASIAR